MSHKPPIPGDKELPERVNGWVHDPEDTRNGHVWVGEDAERSVVVFGSLDRVRVAVYDDRVDSGEYVNLTNQTFDDVATQSTDAVLWGVQKAVGWMEQTHPTEWEHPEVEPAVFEAPPGYELAYYAIGNRAYTVYYRRVNGKDAWEMIGEDLLDDSEPSIKTRKYLYIKTWKGSGNSTIALAPWTRGHEHQMKEIVDPPEECGLAKAVRLTYEWVAEQKIKTPLQPR